MSVLGRGRGGGGMSAGDLREGQLQLRAGQGSPCLEECAARVAQSPEMVTRIRPAVNVIGKHLLKIR